ncbi:UNKNOWN [Stylonychia lemnae]|uniref:Uncharacterized protein n=1 Tax=Stylonychia lemnae TaxID=5949 RepID=A0A078ACF0_STYLE|nr:UNKNOWN [Stylonychia lemnae]|eukprot:CDW79531.1 UNKNOWN [Stylonychia lemnae]
MIDTHQENGEIDDERKTFDIPLEVLDKYFGPQNLFITSMQKSESNLLIEFNRQLKDTYFSIFHEGDESFPKYMLQIPVLRDMMTVLEEDLSKFKFTKVFEFESFIDTVILFAMQSLKEFNRAKKQAYVTMRSRIKDLSLQSIQRNIEFLTKDERMAFIMRNEDNLGRIIEEIVEFDIKKDDSEAILNFSLDLCQFIKIQHRKRSIQLLMNQISNVFKTAFNECLEPFRDLMHYMSQSNLKILEDLHQQIQEDKIEEQDIFEKQMNMFFSQLSNQISKFIWVNRTIMTKLKKLLMENAVASIMEDIERLPDTDRDQFMMNHQEMLEKAMADGDYIDFKVFDIDLLLEKQRELVKNLQLRDNVWFIHFRD